MRKSIINRNLSILQTLFASITESHNGLPVIMYVETFNISIIRVRSLILKVLLDEIKEKMLKFLLIIDFLIEKIDLKRELSA
jgi:hypothetical protein